ncbi:unnamed protein product, partial [Nesidiocoris tenuis]
MFRLLRTFLESRDEFKYSFDCIDILLRSQLLNLQQFDLNLAHAIDNGQNFVALSFAQQIIQYYIIDERPSNILTEQDVIHTIEVLARIVSLPRPAPEG